MARSGRSSQKSGARRVTLGILIFGALALIVAQSAPQISNFFVPARTTISDRIGAPADPGELDQGLDLRGKGEPAGRHREEQRLDAEEVALGKSRTKFQAFLPARTVREEGHQVYVCGWRDRGRC